MNKQQVGFDVPFREEISRLFIFRFLAVIPLMFVIWIIAVWVGITSMIQFWYMLFLGKRNRYLWDQYKRAFVWFESWRAYLGLMVDVRPKYWW